MERGWERRAGEGKREKGEERGVKKKKGGKVER